MVGLLPDGSHNWIAATKQKEVGLGKRRMILFMVAITWALLVPGAFSRSRPVTPQAYLPLVSHDPWITLFNGVNLDGWYTWLPSTGRNNDPRQVFKVTDGMLHFLDLLETGADQEFGYLGSEQEYGNVLLHVEYRWGVKRFPPRATAKRDSGILYLVTGADTIWPRSVEAQVQEGDTGDLVLLNGPVVDTTVASLSATPRRYQPGGIAYTAGTGGSEYIYKSAAYDSLTEWNTVEVQVQNGSLTHRVNGELNFFASNLRHPDPAAPGTLVPLNRGRILLQAEGAEIFYRTIKIRHLP
jgi:hypothetical protein